MRLEIRALAEFYESPKGQVARLMIAHRLRSRWSNLAGRRVLGLGYAIPYLRPYLSEAERVIAAMPEAQGVRHWPKDGRNRATLVDEQALPFPDASFDCLLLVHALELSEAQRPFMREMWRVLAPEGRLLVVVPNRASLWAQLENSPFGHGLPYSRAQLARLLEQSLFTVENWDSALYMPPFGRRSARTGAGWDRLGRRVWPQLAGVHLVEASKSLYALAPAAAAGGRRRLIPAIAGGRS
jgi:SAM-dependent methyltransferase